MPFNDTQTVVRPPPPSRDGMDTTGWDAYRQGVEISQNKFRFMGTQPKLWSGEITGETSIVTYGQNPGTIQADSIGLAAKFEDTPGFNPVAYIVLGVAYPLPITLNDGPSAEFESCIEPLAIPFRKPTNEGPHYAHAFRGDFENGNTEGYVIRSTNQIEQFVGFQSSRNNKFFLDEGGDYFGNIPREPYISDVGNEPIPFDDTLPYLLNAKLKTTNQVFNQVEKLGSEMGQDNISPYGKKSSSAGCVVYGLNAGEYGTDSIAFNGWGLGS